MVGTIKTARCTGIGFENRAPVTQELAAGPALARYLGFEKGLPKKIPLWTRASERSRSPQPLWRPRDATHHCFEYLDQPSRSRGVAYGTAAGRCAMQCERP